MHLHRAEGFLYTQLSVERKARPMVTRNPVNDDREVFGYAYTARRFPRPAPTPVLAAVLAAVPEEGLRLVFGYAYTARYEPMHNERIRDDRVEQIAA
jgi:hypothetical protein